MKVNIKGEEKNIAITSVILGNDIDDPKKEKLNMFFCPRCQNEVIQFTGSLIKIVPYSLWTRPPVIAKCRNCKRYYAFNEIM